MSAAVTCGSLSSSWAQAKDSPFKRNSRDKNRHNENGFRVSCVSSAVGDPYKTLKIRRGASESEVKKAFRQLALQYHPDVCRGSNCGTKFHQINEAYDIVMSHLRGESRSPLDNYDVGPDDQSTGGMYDDDWELSEEWMGWEAAGIRDYANPYIEMNM